VTDLPNIHCGRKAFLDVMRLRPEEKRELEADAWAAGYIGGLAKVPKPVGGDVIRMTMDDEFARQVIWCQLQAANPDNDDWQRKVAAFAWHMLRERIDVWEPDPQIWAEFSPRWMIDMDRAAFGGVGVLVYDTWISPFELERYFINPWIRCHYWLTHGALARAGLPEDWSSHIGPALKNAPGNVHELLRWYESRKSHPGFEPCMLELPATDFGDRVFSWNEFRFRQDQITLLSVALLVFRNQLGSGLVDVVLRGVWRRLINQLQRKLSNFPPNFLEKVAPAIAVLDSPGGRGEM
jgi:hypothetical protein